MNDQSMPDQDSAEVSYSFGQRLSSARRALNLSREQVAAELRLNMGLIKALEEEDYSNLPTHMYVAGYLRNYARLLKIPSEPLLAALDNAQLESPPLISEASRPPKASHSKLLVKLFGLLLFVVVVAGIVSWFQAQDFALFSDKPVMVDKIEEQELKALPAPLPEKPVVDEIVNETETSDMPETETGAEPVTVVPVVEEDTSVEEVAAPKVESPVAQPVVLKQAGELVLKYSGDCWTEVKDSSGEKLVYDLYREGQSKRVTGIPPFDIFLGSAAAVTIEYNGRPYDASSHITGNLARFRLGQKNDYKSTAE